APATAGAAAGPEDAQPSVQPDGGEPPARATRRRARKTAEPVAIPAEASVTDESGASVPIAEEPPARATRTRRRAKAAATAAEPAEPAPAAAAPEATAPETAPEDAAPEPPSRRRRAVPAPVPFLPPVEEAAEPDDAEETGPVTRRRRTRRRRGAADADTPADDSVPTVVRIREPRGGRDEVQGVTGSTRLEAKRQRRRDGREQRRTRPPILSESEFL